MTMDFISQVPLDWYWLFLLVSVFIENVFPPYPGDSVVVFAGYVAGTGRISFPVLSASIITGNLLSATLMYYFGLEIMEFMLKHLRSEKLKKIFSRETLTTTHNWFERFGIWAVIFSRFSAGIRFFIAIIAGMVRMHISLFLAAFLIATIIWNSLLVYGGYILGKNWDHLLGYIRLYSGIIALIIVVVISIWAIRFYRGEKNKSPDHPDKPT
ncbi:DedA family protein [Patescibacteria group bacterium]|nr:DedA family protein [Patescibacteria group bacterium]